MKQVVQFMLSMEDIRDLFGSYLKDPSVDKPTFNIKVDFRTSRDREAGGNLIVDWYVKTDEMTTIEKHDKKTEGSWSYGSPITVGFKWPDAENIPKPISDSAQANLKVEGSTAEYVYDSQWALLWLIRDRMAPAGSFSKVSNPNPYILKFNIQLTDQTNTTVYNAIRIQGETPKKGLAKVITLPIFPVFAPELPVSVAEIKNKAVLTEGTVEGADFSMFSTKKSNPDSNEPEPEDKKKKEEEN